MTANESLSEYSLAKIVANGGGELLIKHSGHFNKQISVLGTVLEGLTVVQRVEMYTPNYVGIKGSFLPDNSFVWNEFVFFDVNHASNSEKQFFVAKMVYENSETLKVFRSPQSMDSAWPSWPTEATSILYGREFVSRVRKITLYLVQNSC